MAWLRLPALILGQLPQELVTCCCIGNNCLDPIPITLLILPKPMHSYLISVDIGICHILSTSSFTGNLCFRAEVLLVTTPVGDIQLLSYVDTTFAGFFQCWILFQASSSIPEGEVTSIAACTAVLLFVMNNSPLSWLTITLTFSCSFIVDLCPGDMGYHSLAANPKFSIVCACMFIFTCMHIWCVIQQMF